jgi:hypothetical protein
MTTTEITGKGRRDDFPAREGVQIQCFTKNG